MRGWLPIRIGMDARSNQAVAWWMEFGAAKLKEPFFEQTLTRLRSADPPAKEALLPLESVLAVTEDLAPVEPAGFIFHVSSCGSTLIANAMKSIRGTVVASEPQPFSIPLHPVAESFVQGADVEWELVREELLRSVVSLYSRYRSGEAEKLVIKFPSWCTLYWPLIRSLWPGVPCLMIIRDPAEVIVKLLEGVGWMRLQETPEEACRLLSWADPPRPVNEMSGEEYAARVLQKFFASAEAMPAERTMVLDYTQIDAAKLEEIARFFGLGDAVSRERIERVLGVNAKDPHGVRPFRSDIADKQRRATPLVRTAAFQWADAAYRDLKKRA